MNVTLLDILKIIWRKLGLIILTAVIFVAATIGISALASKPRYQVKATIYASVAGDNPNPSSSTLAYIEKMIDNCMEICTTTKFMDDVIRQVKEENLKVGQALTYTELGSMINYEKKAGTLILNIKVTNTDADTAFFVAKVASELINSYMQKIDSYCNFEIYSPAAYPKNSLPGYSMFAVFAMGLVGMIVGALAAILYELYYPIIRSTEYIEKKSGVKILGSIRKASKELK